MRLALAAGLLFAAAIPAPAPRVVLVPPGEAGKPELSRLAADLDRAAAEMAPRLPLPPAALAGKPVTVAVLPDYVAQARE